MLTDDDIRRVVSRNAFQAGLRYQMDRRVKDLRVAPDGGKIEARVVGGASSPYRQTVRLDRGPNGELSAYGACTCPVGLNCKHVAAVLFQYRKQAPSEPDLPSPPAAAAKPVEAPLPHEVDAWLRSLDAAQEEDSEDYPATVRRRLLYVLERGAHPGSLSVSPQSIELRRDGTPGGAPKRHAPDQLLRPNQQPKFLRPSDRAILRGLGPIGTGAGEEFVETLRRIVATGRGRWAAWDGPVLTEGGPVRGELAWTMSDDGRQLCDVVVPDKLAVLRLDSPWFVDPATGVVGPVETGLPAKVVRAMLASPALPAAIAGRVCEEMGRRWPDSPMPAPRPVAPPQTLREPLRPHLLLLGGNLPFDPAATAGGRYRATAPHHAALARLSWRYGPFSLSPGRQWQPDHVAHHGGVLFQVVRDLRAEERASERVRMLGLRRASHVCFLPQGHPHDADLLLADPDPAAWIDFVLDDAPRLRDDGWLVEVADDFPWRLVQPTGDFSFELREGSGTDWFDLDLGIVVDGERVNLVPAVLELIGSAGAALAAGGPSDDHAAPLLLPLPDGRLLAVPLERLRPILAPLLELFSGAAFDEGSATLRLSRSSAGDLAALEALSEGGGVAWSGGEAVRALGRQLREHGGIPPCATPDGFGATLRPYQEQGLAWLQFLRSAGLGGVLADDMGLGKTVQALAHLAVEQRAGRLDRPALVVCPTSLVGNWRAEAARFAPSLRTLVLHGPDRATRFEAIGQHDLVVTTYPLLARDHATLTAQEWHVVVLDEAQTIKNPLATTSKLARTLRASQRLCLSGTPLENHLGELWSLFDFLAPGFLGDRKQFGLRYRNPIEKAGNVERQKSLAQRVAPFLLRRTKQAVAADLPAKTEITEAVEMGDGQRAVYEGIRLAMHARVRDAIARHGLAKSGIVILDALLKLRQACCDPRLLKLATAKAAKAKSAKLERLLELLPQMLEDGRRVLLFSQFTSMLALVEAELDRLGLPHVLLTGDTRDRATPVERFQSGAVPLFLVSLKAGGVGLNLTAADTVIHYDPWWNPAVERQATDRAHRIGQDKPVFVHRLVTSGTIEEKMEVMKQRKQALADGILGGSAGSALALTEGDLELLFAPDA